MNQLFLVSGAQGQLGAQIIAELEKRNNLYQTIQLQDNYTENQQTLEKACSDYQKIIFIHCATKIWPKSRFDTRLNTNIPNEIYDILTKIRKDFLFVFVSTTNTIIPSLQDNYSVSKRQAESLLQTKKAIIVRPDLIWGKQTQSKHLKQIKKSIFQLFGRKILLFPGIGHTYLPSHPRDVAYSIIESCLDSYKGKDINIIGDEPMHIFDLIKKTCQPDLIIIDMSLGIGKYFPTKLRGFLLKFRFLQQISPLNRPSLIDLNRRLTRPLLVAKCPSKNSWSL